MPPSDPMQNLGSIIPEKSEDPKDLMPTERKSMWRTADERRMSDLTRVMEWLERRRGKKLSLVQAQLQKQAQAQAQAQPQAQPQPQAPKVCTAETLPGRLGSSLSPRGRDVTGPRGKGGRSFKPGGWGAGGRAGSTGGHQSPSGEQAAVAPDGCPCSWLPAPAGRRRRQGRSLSG